MRYLTGCALIAVVASVAACGSTAAKPATALTIVAVNSDVGRAVFRLRCQPPRGDLPDNAAACAAVESTPKLVTAPKPSVCIGGTTSWWDITISGRVHGHRLRHTVSTCWTPQMAMIRRLGLGRNETLVDHLLPRRVATVLPGIQRSFPSGTLRPGDLVTCTIRGHRLDSGVSSSSRFGMSVGYEGANVVPVTLDVALKRDGTLQASCRDGGGPESQSASLR
jgi:hypothetical protein